MDKGTGSVVYFIQNDITGNIKIGVTTDVWQRVSAIKGFSGGGKVDILGVIPGGHRREREIHKRFEDWRVAYEWFRPCSELVSYIKRHAQEPPPKEVQVYDPPTVDLGNITIQEAAKICHTHEDTIRKAIKRGDIEATKFGRQWAVLRESAEDFRDNPPRMGRPPNARDAE